jgi:hypothetical protein
VTMKQFVRAIRDAAKEQPRPVLAVDFEPCKDGVRLTFRCRQ